MRANTGKVRNHLIFCIMLRIRKGLYDLASAKTAFSNIKELHWDRHECARNGRIYEIARNRYGEKFFRISAHLARERFRALGCVLTPTAHAQSSYPSVYEISAWSHYAGGGRLRESKDPCGNSDKISHFAHLKRVG